MNASDDLSVGLDARHLMRVVQTPVVKARLMTNIRAAHELGAFGSPTFFVRDEMFFGKDRLREVEEEIERRR